MRGPRDSPDMSTRRQARDRSAAETPQTPGNTAATLLRPRRHRRTGSPRTTCPARVPQLLPSPPQRVSRQCAATGGRTTSVDRAGKLGYGGVAATGRGVGSCPRVVHGEMLTQASGTSLPRQRSRPVRPGHAIPRGPMPPRCHAGVKEKRGNGGSNGPRYAVPACARQWPSDGTPRRCRRTRR